MRQSHSREQAAARYRADAPDHVSWEMRWPSANSRSAELIFFHRCRDLSDGCSDIVRATKSVTCFGSRRGVGVLGEQNALVAMAVNMHRPYPISRIRVVRGT